MTWVVYDPTTMNILRLDYGAQQPQGESFVHFEQVIAWPSIPDGHVFRVVNGLPVVVDARSPQQAFDAAAAAARRERSRLFAETDWVRWRAQDRGEQVPQAWLDFWQGLRDVTEQAGFPFNINWPERPN